MSPFLTVAEAARMTGKSSSSIRRIIYPIVKDEKHPNRSQIQPNVDEVQQLRMKGENFAWRISEELLRRAVPPEPAVEKGSERFSGRNGYGSDAGLIETLRGELTIKNQQITQQAEMLTRQMELISGLSERLREGNVLIGRLQQQHAIPEEAAPSKSKPIETVTKATPASKPAAKTPQKAASKPPKAKRGFFSRLFH